MGERMRLLSAKRAGTTHLAAGTDGIIAGSLSHCTLFDRTKGFEKAASFDCLARDRLHWEIDLRIADRDADARPLDRLLFATSPRRDRQGQALAEVDDRWEVTNTQGSALTPGNPTLRDIATLPCAESNLDCLPGGAEFAQQRLFSVHVQLRQVRDGHCSSLRVNRERGAPKW
jgi:hypothetical protein